MEALHRFKVLAIYIGLSNTSSRLLRIGASRLCVKIDEANPYAIVCHLRPQQLDHGRLSNIHVQLAILYKYATPNKSARLAYSLQRSTSQPKGYCRLPFAHGLLVTIGKMRNRAGTRNLEEPDKIIEAIAFVMFTTAHIMQRVHRIESHRAPDTVRNQCIQFSALVYFIEMQERLDGEELFTVLIEGWRALHIVYKRTE